MRLLWFRNHCGCWRLVSDPELLFPSASASSLTCDYCSYFLFTVFWICPKPLPKILCPGFPVSDIILSVLIPACLPWPKLPRPSPTSFLPSPPSNPHPTCVYQLYLCWDHNRWVREKFTPPHEWNKCSLETFLSAKITTGQPIRSTINYPNI